MSLLLDACPVRLTSRQIEILQHIAEGETSAEVGWALGLSPKTVDKAVDQILTALDARNRTHAVALGLRRGLIR